jgi:hypothetical protein
MFWRRTSAYRDVLPRLADVIRELAPALVGGETRAA